MRYVVGFLACTVAAACLAADPETPATDASLTAQPATPAASATPAAAPAPASAPAASTPSANNATSELREKHFKSEGYTVKMHNGGKLYCRTDIGTGSRIPKEQCYSEDALVRAETITPGSSASMGNNSHTAPVAITGGH